jgi:hypothetical protein
MFLGFAQEVGFDGCRRYVDLIQATRKEGILGYRRSTHCGTRTYAK